MLLSTELYSTSKGISRQCDITNTLQVQFKDYFWSFTIRDFLDFRKKVNAVDLRTLLFNLSDECDIVSLHASKHSTIVTLTLCDLIKLRELLDGTKFSLEVISMVHEVLGDYTVV